MSSLLACQSIVAMVFDKRLQEPVSVGKRGRSFDKQCPIVPARRFSDAPLMATERKRGCRRIANWDGDARDSGQGTVDWRP